MFVYLLLRDVSRYMYSGPMSNRGIPQETNISVSCLQQGRVCSNYIVLSGKAKNFKDILTKLVTHNRTFESERRRNYKSKGLHQVQSQDERLHVVEKQSPAKRHWTDPNPFIAQKWSADDDEVRIQVFRVWPYLWISDSTWRIFCCFEEILLVHSTGKCM